jgi:hypothetical protein
MYRLRATPTEVARTLLVVMRRGSLSAAEEITGHQVETIRRWLRAAARHAEALTEVLVHDLHLSEVEVDAFDIRPLGAYDQLGLPDGRDAQHPKCRCGHAIGWPLPVFALPADGCENALAPSRIESESWVILPSEQREVCDDLAQDFET